MRRLLRYGWRRLRCALFGCHLVIWHRDKRQFKCICCGELYTQFDLGE